MLCPRPKLKNFRSPTINRLFADMSRSRRRSSMEAIAAQMEPYAPLLERMTLTEAQKSRPYLCKRHHARIPAGCH